MNSIIKKIATIIIIIILGLGCYTTYSHAASFSITSGISEITVGKSYTISINAKGLTGKFNITHSSNVSVNMDSIWVENGSAEGTIKVTANKEGTATVTIAPDEEFGVSDSNGLVSLSPKTDTVIVKAKESDNNSTGGSDDNNDDKTETPSMSFTSVNETVYATDSVNVRSSPSTSGTRIGSLSEGDSVTRTGIGDGWSRIKYEGQTAYVSSSYLDTTKPKTTENDKKDEEDDKKNEDDNENKSNAKELSSLTVDQYKLEPDFNPDITEYSLTVGRDVENLVIEAVASDEKATVEITGNNGLLLGENTVNIKVTAEDGTVRTYKINVTKVEEIGLKLSELTVENYALSPEFSSDVYEYTLNIGDISVTSLNIIAKSNNENVNVEIAGNNNLKPGENIITILVSSDEGDTTTVYQIIVNIDEAFKNQVATTDNSNMYMYIGVGAAVVILLIIIIVVVRKRRKAAEEEFAPLNTYDLNFSSNNNVTNKDAVNETEKDIDTKEEKTRKKKKDKLEEEEYSLNSNGYDSNETPRKRGKHF